MNWVMRPTNGRRLTLTRQAPPTQGTPMADVAYLALILAFFAVTALLVRGVDRL